MPETKKFPIRYFRGARTITVIITDADEYAMQKVVSRSVFYQGMSRELLRNSEYESFRRHYVEDSVRQIEEIIHKEFKVKQ